MPVCNRATIVPANTVMKTVAAYCGLTKASMTTKAVNTIKSSSLRLVGFIEPPGLSGFYSRRYSEDGTKNSGSVNLTLRKKLIRNTETRRKKLRRPERRSEKEEAEKTGT
jgi:hypothetical protein